MEIRPLVREEMLLENGAFGQRLLPWETVNAPFEGAWVTVPAGGATGAHEHHEYELFIAISGTAEVEVDGDRRPFTAGDVEFHAPHKLHRVINASDTDFEFYAIWWDTNMSEKFVACDEERA
jgi:mannose-6-phosphate isomerase-like protein (cupin superfamily)